MTKLVPDNPFYDCELGPDVVLGIHTFADVLFIDDTERPVSVLTGETPAHSQATVKEAKEFATGIDSDMPPITLLTFVASQIKMQSNPYTVAAFFHFKATGSFERQRAYHAAYEADTFVVDFEGDYESGDLTIIVEEDSQSERITP